MTSVKKRGGAMIPVYIEGGEVTTTQSGSAISEVEFGDSTSLDAFGRIRSSGPSNRADVEFIYDKQPTLIDEVTAGGGTVTHVTNTRDLTLAIVDAVDATEAAMYSYDVPYTPGNSQLIDITGNLDFAEIGGGTAAVFLRSSVSGSVVETVVNQASWNKSTADTVDWTKSHIFSMDFQSLKVGRIRFNLIMSGIYVPVHEMNNDNVNTAGFWQLPSLPFYWRIYNDSGNTISEIGYGDESNGVGFRYTITANASATMKAICATVKSEGGKPLFEIPGFVRSIDSGITDIAVSTTLIPLISIRPAATFNSLTNRALYIPTAFFFQTDNAIRYVILLRPTLTGPSWTAVDATNSGMEYDVTASAISGGVQIASGYLSSGNNKEASGTGALGRSPLKLGRTGTSDILTFAAIRTSTNNADVFSGFQWREIR